MLYADGSLNICPEGQDLIRARKELESSSDDGDTLLVEVEVRVVQTFGPKRPQIVQELSAICPTCHTEVYIDNPSAETEGNAA